MARRELVLELLTDVSVPESGRSLGGARSLSYIPGRALWGAAATNAYRQQMPPADIFRLFYQGEVRFFDAVPTLDGSRTYPTPRSWHSPKYGGGVRNLCHPEARQQARSTQHLPLEPFWRDAHGEPVTVETRYSMRTSITASGQASKGLLFGLDAIPAGTRLHSQLEGEEEDLQQILPLLLRDDLRLGRSRSAEFGRVALSQSLSSSWPLELETGEAHHSLHFLCCSRLALRNEKTGQPTFQPQPHHFYLPSGWVLQPEASFVRTERFSPFNAYRRRPELERHLIQTGSVFTFVASEETEPLSLETLREQLGGGVGIWRHEGLGHVLVQPRWLTAEEISLSPPRSFSSRPALRPSSPKDPLFLWASQRARERVQTQQAFAWAEEESRHFARFRLNPSQWGELHRMAREARYRSDGPAWLKERLHSFVTQGLRALSQGWGAQSGEERASSRLKKIIDQSQDDLPIRLELLASRGLRQASEKDQ